MKYLIIIGVALSLMVGLFFYGVHVGKVETENKYLNSSQEGNSITENSNEDSKEKYPEGNDEFPNIWNDLCKKQ